MIRKKRDKKSKSQISAISFKRKLRSFVNNATNIIKILSVIFVVSYVSFKIYKTGKDLFIEDIADTTSEILGFNLEKLYIEGQNNVSKNAIFESLNADIGTSLLTINLEKTAETLKKDPWVKNVIVKRELPNKIRITLFERSPIALWQKNKQIYVIDSEGYVISNANPAKFPHLIHVVGNDANLCAQHLIEDLNSDPKLIKKVKSAVRFGERRWDLYLDEGILVKMPQLGFNKAWENLSNFDKKGKLFGNKIRLIDMRNSTKYYVEKYDSPK